jgi:hypothetical protein
MSDFAARTIEGQIGAEAYDEEESDLVPIEQADASETKFSNR